MDYIRRFWRITLYILGLAGLIVGILKLHTVDGIIIWLACNMCILVPEIAEISFDAIDGDDDYDEY